MIRALSWCLSGKLLACGRIPAKGRCVKMIS